jgi:hypothetical protein
MFQPLRGNVLMTFALAVRSSVAGVTGWGVWLRVIVAVGFVLLGNPELRRRRRSRPK